MTRSPSKPRTFTPSERTSEHILAQLGRHQSETKAKFAAEITVAEPARKTKYNSTKARGPLPMGAGFRTYDSKREAARAESLELLRRAGEIAWWVPQVTFPLPPPAGAKSSAYVADFLIMDNSGRFRIEDAKGFKTREYIRKRKAMKEIYNIEVKEV